MAPAPLSAAVAVVALASMASFLANADRPELDMHEELAVQGGAARLASMLQMANAKCKEATEMTTIESTLQAMRDCLNVVKQFPEELTRRKASGVLRDQQFQGELSDLRSFLELADAKIGKVYSKQKSTLDSHRKKLREDLHDALATLREAKDMKALGQERSGSMPASFMQVDNWKQKRGHGSIRHRNAGTGKHTRHLHGSLSQRKAGTRERIRSLHRSFAHNKAGTRKHTRDLHSAFGGSKAGHRKLSRFSNGNLKRDKTHNEVQANGLAAHRRLAGGRLAKALQAKRKAFRHATKPSKHQATRKIEKTIAKSTKTELMHQGALSLKSSGEKSQAARAG